MVAPADNSATLNTLVSVANSKIEPKLLTNGNYQVLSIKPLRSTTSKHNTIADIRVDLAADAPIAIVSTDRYSRRLVEFTRIDLKDIAKFRGLEKNALGQYIGEITDAASAIALLDAAIEEDEIIIIKTATSTVVKAVEDSLGYIGAVTFAGAVGDGEDEEEPTPVDPRLNADNLLGITAFGNNLFVTDDNMTPHLINDLTTTVTHDAAAGTFNFTVSGIWDRNVVSPVVMFPIVLGNELFATAIDGFKAVEETAVKLVMRRNGSPVPAIAFGAEDFIPATGDGRYMIPLPLEAEGMSVTIELSTDDFVTVKQTVVTYTPAFEVIEKTVAE